MERRLGTARPLLTALMSCGAVLAVLLLGACSSETGDDTTTTGTDLSVRVEDLRAQIEAGARAEYPYNGGEDVVACYVEVFGEVYDYEYLASEGLAGDDLRKRMTDIDDPYFTQERSIEWGDGLDDCVRRFGVRPGPGP